MAPTWSPDGQSIAFSKEGYRGLFVVAAENPGSLKTIIPASNESFSAYRMKWTPDSSTIFPYNSRDRDDLFAVTLEGKTLPLSEKRGLAQAADEPQVTVLNGEILIGVGKTITKIASGPDQYLAPVVSPDKSKIVYLGVITGLYVYDIKTGSTIHIGQGDFPAWSSDSQQIVFDYARDDGHELIASEIYLYDLVTMRLTQLTNTPRSIERRPQFSPDAKRIVFDDRGAIIVADLIY
jgi:Tol biopolymer transport system component